MNKAIRIKAPVTIDLEVTSNCNLNCCFCSNSWRVDPKNQNKGLRGNIQAIIKKIVDADVLAVLISGGEATIEPDLVNIIKLAYDHGLLIDLTSNGTFEQISIADIAEYISSIGISIHGFESQHDKLVNRSGAFKLALEGIAEAVDLGIPTGCLFTAIKENYHNFGSLAHFLKNNYDVKQISATRFVPVGRGKLYRSRFEMSINEMLELINTIYTVKNSLSMKINLSDSFPRCLVPPNQKDLVTGCNAAIFSAAIDPWGNFKACAPSPSIVGNVFESSIEDLWNSNLFYEIRSFEWVPEKCKSCSDFDLCLCGCRISHTIPYGPDTYLVSEKYENK